MARDIDKEKVEDIENLKDIDSVGEDEITETEETEDPEMKINGDAESDEGDHEESEETEIEKLKGDVQEAKDNAAKLLVLGSAECRKYWERLESQWARRDVWCLAYRSFTMRDNNTNNYWYKTCRVMYFAAGILLM